MMPLREGEGGNCCPRRETATSALELKNHRVAGLTTGQTDPPILNNKLRHDRRVATQRVKLEAETRHKLAKHLHQMSRALSHAPKLAKLEMPYVPPSCLPRGGATGSSQEDVKHGQPGARPLRDNITHPTPALCPRGVGLPCVWRCAPCGRTL